MDISEDKSKPTKKSKQIDRNCIDDYLEASVIRHLTNVENSNPAIFKGLLNSLEVQKGEWQDWIASKNPHLIENPFNKLQNVILSSAEKQFMQLILLKILRMDKLESGVVEYIRSRLGERYCSSPPTRLQYVYEQSSCSSPIIFVLSPGCDPSRDLIKLAESCLLGADKLKVIFLSFSKSQ